MNIANFSGDKSVSELARRIFHLPPKTSAAQLKQAEESLLQANPGLRSLKEWSAGAPILVPRLPGFQATTSSTLFDLASELITEEEARALAQLRQAIASAARQNLAEAAAVLTVLKSKPVKDSSGKLADVKARVTRIAASTKNRQAEVKTEHAQLEKVLAEVSNSMKS